MNRSEEFVYNLCKKSFLSIWSIPNPLRKDCQKELCDILIVCDPDIIIISVKEIDYKPTEDIITGWNRWNSRAIEESIKQIYGAEKELSSITQVLCKDRTPHLFLPSIKRRHIHRLAVALGSKGEIPISLGQSKHGFVNVFTEQSIGIVLRELDTITDFIEYLSAKERLLTKTETEIVTSGEEHLLAVYLHDNFISLEKADMVVLEDIWKEFCSKKEFHAKKEADKESYFWDKLIEFLIKEHDPYLTKQEGAINEPNPGIEKIVRIMARENRFSRRILSKLFNEFYMAGDLRARTIQSSSGIRYVFLVCPRDHNREARKNELMTRCFIVRGRNPDSKTVVGIATETYQSGQGFTLDACVFEKEIWTEENQKELERLQKETGAFVSPKQTPFNEDEYPNS
jgi:hypothetical protein